MKRYRAEDAMAFMNALGLADGTSHTGAALLAEREAIKDRWYRTCSAFAPKIQNGKAPEAWRFPVSVILPRREARCANQALAPLLAMRAKVWIPSMTRIMARTTMAAAKISWNQSPH